jgi:hypothetical protein
MRYSVKMRGMPSGRPLLRRYVLAPGYPHLAASPTVPELLLRWPDGDPILDLALRLSPSSTGSMSVATSCFSWFPSRIELSALGGSAGRTSNGDWSAVHERANLSRLLEDTTHRRSHWTRLRGPPKGRVTWAIGRLPGPMIGSW